MMSFNVYMAALNFTLLIVPILHTGGLQSICFHIRRDGKKRIMFITSKQWRRGIRRGGIDETIVRHATVRGCDMPVIGPL
jgi:hypothetical protein